MNNKLILFFSFLLALVGLSLPTKWLAMYRGENGGVFIPVSSGSEDPFIIKLALSSYITSFVLAATFLALKKQSSFLTIVFYINSTFYFLCMILVCVDSNPFQAAIYGNWAPVSQMLLWLVSICTVSWVTFNKTIKDHP